MTNSSSVKALDSLAGDGEHAAGQRGTVQHARCTFAEQPSWLLAEACTPESFSVCQCQTCKAHMAAMSTRRAMKIIQAQEGKEGMKQRYCTYTHTHIGSARRHSFLTYRGAVKVP